MPVTRAGAAALAGTFTACLAAPHPATGDGGNIGLDGGSASTCTPTAIDGFDVMPAGCTNGAMAAGGKLMLTTQSTSTTWCTWTMPVGKAVLVHIETVSAGAPLGGYVEAYLGVGFGTSQDAAIAFRLDPYTGARSLEVNDVMQPTSGLASDVWVLFEPANSSAVTARYSPTFAANLASWTQLASVGSTGSTSGTATITLGVISMIMDTGQATFSTFETCP